MNCIEIDDILSTTVLYEGFFCYSDVFKFSKDSVNKLKEITNKYKKDQDTYVIDNENDIYLKNDDNSYLREFVYRFKSFISINKIVYPLFNYDDISYEIIDLSNGHERVILSGKKINVDRKNAEINLNGIKVNYIKLRIKSKKNIWPKISEIKIIKSIY